MKSVQDTYLLHNGVAIPCVGYGTCDTDGEVTVRSVKCALQAGYRLIDTAMFYKNEESVGKGIRESGIPREEITVVSKLWNYDHSYEKAKKSFQESLERLGLDYLDLYLIHWPIPKNEQENYIENNRETWKAFEELYHEGKIKVIGVSNFKPHHLEEIMEGATVMPMVNQIEFHPGWTQMETVNYCKAHHIAVQAWSPFGSGELFRMPEISEMAKKYGKDPGQLALRWIFQHGVIPLPKSVNPERILSNTQIFDFEITPEDMAYIDSLQGGGWCADPDKPEF